MRKSFFFYSLTKQKDWNVPFFEPFFLGKSIVSLPANKQNNIRQKLIDFYGGSSTNILYKCTLFFHFYKEMLSKRSFISGKRSNIE